LANIAAIRSVGTSLVAYLNNAYRESTFPAGVTKPDCTFVLTSIGGVRSAQGPSSEAAVRVIILLYRVSMNQHLRNAGRLTATGASSVPLSVDLHYLASFWAQSAENEQLVLAWTLRQLHDVPVLDSSILGRDAAWAPDELIQLIPEEIPTEDLMRVWDTLEPDYRLSVSYIARVVRIDPAAVGDARQVVATRIEMAVPRQPQ
jgi:Pvc16 N-terminal domain